MKLIIKMQVRTAWLKRSWTHIDEIFAEAFLQVAEEGSVSGFIQEDKILDSHPVPGRQGAFHVKLALCNELH